MVWVCDSRASMDVVGWTAAISRRAVRATHAQDRQRHGEHAEPGRGPRVALVAVGVAQQIHIGWTNIHLAIDDGRYPDANGAKWIDAHTPPDAVVLARRVPIVCYYSHRRVQWFPPIL
jgi:hypothetical protein